MSDNQKRLVSSIVDFLKASIADGSIKAEDSDGIEVAGQSNHRHPSLHAPTRSSPCLTRLADLTSRLPS